MLCVSGRGGIFVDCIRDAIPAQVQWLARIDNEPASAYLERGLRMSAQLGLASQGGRIGARSHRDPSAAIPRVWVLPHVPLSWGPPEITKVLAQSFDSVTLINHRRMGREQLYRFRGTHKFGDRDIVPLQVQVAEAEDASEITMWATVAPVKTPCNKQTWLRDRAVPLVTPQPQALKTTLVKVPQALSGNEDDKDQQLPPAQTRAVSLRAVPDGCKLVEAPKDGSCMYHAMAKGLHWLTGKSYSHRDLRAKANEHLRKHSAQYRPEFDGQGPALEKLRDKHPGDDAAAFEEYLTLAACESAFASTLEIKALSRIYNVCIVVISRDPHFGNLTFKERRKTKTIVLWYSPKHIDLLLPSSDEAGYPDSLFAPSPGQIIDLRASGRSTASQASTPSSKWTRASGAVSTIRSAGAKPKVGLGSSSKASVRTGTVWTSTPVGKASKAQKVCTREPSDELSQDLEHCEEPPPPKPPRKPIGKQCPMPNDRIFRCTLCPFMKLAKDEPQYERIRAKHCSRAHGGQGRPGRRVRPSVVKVTRAARRARLIAWECPYCPHGITWAQRQEVPKQTCVNMKKDHYLRCHRDVPYTQWLADIRPKQQGVKDRQAHQATVRHRKLKKLALDELQSPRFPGMTPFLWPLLRNHGKQNRRPGKRKAQPTGITRVSLQRAWRCNQCGFFSRNGHKARDHEAPKCAAAPWQSSATEARLQKLTELTAWVQAEQLTTDDRDMILQATAEARKIIEQSPSSQPSSGF